MELKRLESLKIYFRKMILQELQKRGNLSRLRWIAQNSVNTSNSKDEYVDYIIEEYQ